MRISLFSWLFLNSFIAVFFSIAVVLVSGQCQSDQRDLLLRLKDGLNSTLSVKLLKWNQTTDCCFWDGVTCDAGGRVIALNLSNQSISGVIDNSSSLFSLHNLQSLNLAYNRFNSIIPSRLDVLANLSFLNLSNAGFKGQIPVAISQMTRLVTLDLSTLNFPGQVSLELQNPNLRMLVQNLSMLEELYLDGVNISAQGKEWCQAISASLSKLQVLSMSNCYLSGPIEPHLQNLTNLSVIRLDKNNLSATVPAFLAKLPNLTSLRLSSCGLHGPFPKEILQVRMLQSLEISANEKLQGSLPEFPPNGSLRILVLSRTKFSGSLPQSVGNLVNLTRLDLSYCNFGGAILNPIPNLQQLVYLDLSFNNFTGPIPPFDMSRNLAHIDLSHNKLTGTIQSYDWKGLQNLTDIDLSHNALHGDIPSSLLALPLLKKVMLSNNQFDGKVHDIPNVPQSLLDTLDLSSNQLQGFIPMSVFELGRLNILSLSSNKFNGTIWLGDVKKLANLTRLDLSHNKLYVNATGNFSTFSSFPKFTRLELASCRLKVFPDLRNQSKLAYLDLSDNQISDAIPNWIWNVGNGILQHLNLSLNRLESLQTPYQMRGLLVLDLHSNNLSGNIPTLPLSASYLDYSRNHFASSLPHNISDYLSYTIFFSLSSNGLTGVIPDSICKADYLQVLDLSNNNLSGRIPKCLIERNVSLGVLNLGGNSLNGNIPDAFPSHCSIQTLDVNGNELKGEIPRSLSRCKMLEVLDLGNNQINDSFPCHLKNISTLRVLVLRSNEFHGKIDCLPNKAPWPKLQIVDIANNSFSGRLPKQCLATWEAMKVDDNETQLSVKHLQFEILQLSGLYYADGITVTNKGLTMELVKILTLFTSIDLSFNNFEGPIPDVIGEFKALYVLNLSHNALTGAIPPSLGKLEQLESLDLSSNNLNGSIPPQLVNLNFLAVLNLSHNQLEGPIPAGKQFSTFENESYEGNKGLCGYPLTKSCKNANNGHNSQSDAAEKNQNDEFDWEFIFIGAGFGVGAAAAVAPLIFWKRANKWVDNTVDKILGIILPKVGLVYTPPDDAEVKADNTENDDEDEEIKDKYGEFRGRYCVFCSKLDKTRTKAIHDTCCTCYDSPSLSPSSSTSSSFSP
ncbi:PREDICTED: receptor-like protein 12 [Theobroma cacao]|uniref:Receptor-like protein 12 n=1 Tax=Theobroma cacao TaxID=3641 RepID=A0AB32WD13_THECC|nr:PREDICTED: receptor-like protein 12 [Theobroma cacao]